MIKITDIDYSLPVVEAISSHQQFTTGANKPLLVTAVNEHGSKGDYVVKFRGAERMSPEACMREFLAVFIAMQMEIKVVKPVIVHISSEFVELLKGSDAWGLAHKSIGFNYGSQYVPGYKTILVNEDLNNNQLPLAQQVFCFDVFIQNSDRTKEKPNMITDGNEIVIFDHELAFGFALDIFKNPTPWQLRANDLEWINRHCLLPILKGKEFDFAGFSDRLSNLSPEFWRVAKTLIPEEWQSPQFETIRQYLTAICENKESFITELKKLML
jgi:hypothetical protein